MSEIPKIGNYDENGGTPKTSCASYARNPGKVRLKIEYISGHIYLRFDTKNDKISLLDPNL